MPSIASQDLCLAQARNLIPTAKDTEMSFARASDGKVIVSSPGAFGLPVDCSYWREPNVRKGEDSWRYKMTNHGSLSHAGPYSHVSELGCQIAIRSPAFWSAHALLGSIRLGTVQVREIF